MKKFVAMLLAMLLCVSMASCGSSDSNNSKKESDPPTKTEKEAKKTNTPKDSGKLGQYDVAIKDYALAKDYDGKDVIIVNYDFTNNSDKATSFDVALYTQAFQDGVEIESAFMLADSAPYDADAESKDIKTGVTLPVQDAFTLTNTTSPVEIEVTELASFSDEKVVKTFEIAQPTQQQF